MLMHKVKSSNVEAVGHEGNTMRVQYKGGSSFDFPGVTESRFHMVRLSDSVGRAVNQLGIMGVKVVAMLAVVVALAGCGDPNCQELPAQQPAPAYSGPVMTPAGPAGEVQR